jgi:hypothetical protein
MDVGWERMSPRASQIHVYFPLYSTRAHAHTKLHTIIIDSCYITSMVLYIGTMRLPAHLVHLHIIYVRSCACFSL